VLVKILLHSAKSFTTFLTLHSKEFFNTARRNAELEESLYSLPGRTKYKFSLLFAIGNKGREENLCNEALKKLTSGV
jgi:hypothetical protein